MAEKQIYKFTNEITEVEVKSIGAKIILVPADDGAITAEYENPKDNPKFCAVLLENKLSFKETPFINIFGNKAEEDYKITVYLPKKDFAKITVTTTHGGVDVRGVKADKFDLNTASGDIFVNAEFSEIRVKTASGKITVKNSPEITARLVKVNSASGNIEIDARTEKFSICSASGNTVYNNACGEGNVSVASGKIDLNYGEWNGALNISAVSGDVTAALPDGSGMDVDFDGISGILKTDLGSEKGKLMNLGIGTRGTFGGENLHKINVKLTSGNVTVKQQ
ncbi:MAG: DUF4097 family beta strand repeat protein [Oscillospiraceae bacterium]|nr:DUF4097 family beta strand repeat protein [Oscillospiraceae bacterium]